MSRAFAYVLSLPTPAVPRGALLVDWIASAMQAVFAPAAPAVPSRVAEAAAVRELARSVEAQDPRYAADLAAAALRHEAQDASVR